jgi:hypothetical protein
MQGQISNQNQGKR